MIARTTDTTLPEGSLFVARVADLALPRVPWQKISAFDDLIVEIELKGDDLYYRTRKGEPRYKIMKLDLHNPELARAVEVAVPPADGVLEGFVLTRRLALHIERLDAIAPHAATAQPAIGRRGLARPRDDAALARDRGERRVRGSGVYGEPWRMAGFKATKANTWKDGVACAQYLIAQGYASPRTLGVMGTSAGGIFAGRTVTTAPQLFAAAIFNVGVLDAVRAEDSANGITNISEFGSYSFLLWQMGKRRAE